jgi:hypothetical protein
MAVRCTARSLQAHAKKLISCEKLLTWCRSRPSRSRGGLLQCRGDNVLWQVEIFPEELNALGLQVVVVILPVEGLPHKLSALHALHQAQNLEVGHILYLLMGLLEKVLLGYKDALLEKVGVNRNAVLLCDELQDIARKSATYQTRLTPQPVVVRESRPPSPPPPALHLEARHHTTPHHTTHHLAALCDVEGRVEHFYLVLLALLRWLAEADLLAGMVDGEGGA